MAKKKKGKTDERGWSTEGGPSFLDRAPTHADRLGKKWNRCEQDDLVARFTGGYNIEALARMHRRNIGGITARLSSLGLEWDGTGHCRRSQPTVAVNATSVCGVTSQSTASRIARFLLRSDFPMIPPKDPDFSRLDAAIRNHPNCRCAVKENDMNVRLTPRQLMLLIAIHEGQLVLAPNPADLAYLHVHNLVWSKGNEGGNARPTPLGSRAVSAALGRAHAEQREADRAELRASARPDGKFWMVACADTSNPRGGMTELLRPPRVVQQTRFKAGDEASRLAGQNPGSAFVVLEAVEVHRAEVQQSVRTSATKL